MYKQHKRKIWIICIISFVILFGVNSHIDDIDNITITAISIILGFNISALSTLSGKTCIQELSQKRDEENKTKTQLGVLKTYFSKSFTVGVTTIGYVLVKNILIKKNFFIADVISQKLNLWLKSDIDLLAILNRAMEPLEIALLIANFILMKWIFDLLLVYFYRD